MSIFHKELISKQTAAVALNTTPAKVFYLSSGHTMTLSTIGALVGSQEVDEGGAKGCTTFRPSGKRYGILNAKPKEEEAEDNPQEEGAACFIDPSTGKKECE